MDASEPTVRFFVAGIGVVLVQMIYDGTAITTGAAVVAGRWQPSPVALTGSGLLAGLAGGSAMVQLRLTSLIGRPRVDDVFIDPWHRG